MFGARLPQVCVHTAHFTQINTLDPSLAMRAMKTELGRRVFHASLYELCAIALCAPLFSWIMGVPVERMGLLNIATSVIALLWNMAFNAVFDRMLAWRHKTKTFPLRVIHGIAFEAGLGIVAIPLAAWWLNLSLWHAFLLDSGILLFFLPYTFVFNYAYDVIEARWMNRASVKRSANRPNS